MNDFGVKPFSWAKGCKIKMKDKKADKIKKILKPTGNLVLRRRF